MEQLLRARAMLAGMGSWSTPRTVRWALCAISHGSVVQICVLLPVCVIFCKN